jgi:hypothetical protein
MGEGGKGGAGGTWLKDLASPTLIRRLINALGHCYLVPKLRAGCFVSSCSCLLLHCCVAPCDQMPCDQMPSCSMSEDNEAEGSEEPRLQHCAEPAHKDDTTSM